MRISTNYSEKKNERMEIDVNWIFFERLSLFYVTARN